MKSKVQNFGRFLSAMIMPNIGALIAWGLLTAIFLYPNGWFPNEKLASIISPFLTYAIPLLIAYQGGKLVAGERGALMGAIATMGVIMGYTDSTMLMGAMIMGPLAGWVIKQFDKLVKGHIKAGFEMLVNNFSVGILGLAMCIFGYYGIAPVMGALLSILSTGVAFLIRHGVLPLVSIFVEPAKVLFLNNAINHGIFAPLGAEMVEKTGKSILYMIETNPGPGTGVLLAYWVFSKDRATKDSAPGALIVHLLGGIHEISFPYILMHPTLLLATISGSFCAMLWNTFMHLGLSGPAAPGSIIAFVAMAPKGDTLKVLMSVIIAAGVSFLVSMPIILRTNKALKNGDSLEAATAKVKGMKAESKGQAVPAAAGAAAASVAATAAAAVAAVAAPAAVGIDLGSIKSIVFACDAGMGSSAMGATILKKRLADAGIEDIEVLHASVSEIPAGTPVVVCHKDLAERAAQSAPDAKLVTITNFMAAPEYGILVDEIKAARG